MTESPGFTVEVITKYFFDKEHLQSKVAASERRLLSKIGAYVRQRAKSSIRKRKATSQPGQPPSSHEGTLRKYILFGYDPGKKSVVVGPILFGPKTGAPSRLEYGGPGTTRKGKAGFWRPRPFMTPALEHEWPRATQAIKDFIH